MYTIKVLDDREFDKLPYKHVSTAFGCADPKTNKAYVRRTHWGEVSKTFDLLTIQHELDELIADTSPHELDGIRYKSGGELGKMLTPVLGLIPGIGPLLAAGMAIGTSQYSKSKKPEKYGEPGNILDMLGTGAMGYAGGKAGSYLGQGIGGMLTGGGMFGQAGAAGTAGMTGPGAAPYGTAPAGVSTYAPPTHGLLGSGNEFLGGTPFNPLTSPNTINAAGASGVPGLLGAGGSSGAKLTSTTGKGGFDMGNLLNPLTIMGAAGHGIGAMPLNIEAPKIGETASKWLTADTVTKAGAAAREMADVKYGGDFSPSNETLAMIDLQQKDIDKGYDDRLKKLDSSMGAINEQWSRSGERLELYKQINDEREENKQRVSSEWLSMGQQEHSKQQFEYVMNNLQVDEATKRDLLYADMAEVIQKYNIERDDVMSLRNVASQAGLYAGLAGLGII